MFDPFGAAETAGKFSYKPATPLGSGISFSNIESTKSRRDFRFIETQAKCILYPERVSEKAVAC
jgi:hypothetical protein